MSKTFVAPYIQNSKLVTAVVTGAIGNIGTASPTGLILLATGSADGSIITALSALARASGTTSLVLYKSDDNGVTFDPIDSVLLAASTFTTTAAITKAKFADITLDDPIRLGSGQKLYVGSQVAIAAGIIFTARQGDY
jgi:hypothetical protein